MPPSARRWWCRLFPAILAVLCLAAASARADIGEDPAELLKRYGPGRRHNSLINFEVDRFTVSVLLDNGRSSMEIFARLFDDDGKRVEFDQSNPESRVPLTESDLRDILTRNAQGMRWMPGRNKNGNAVFIRQDRKIHAIYSASQRTVTFLPLEAPAPRKDAKPAPR